jgi:hypothetical protein
LWYKWEERIVYFHEDGAYKPFARPWAGGPISLEKREGEQLNVLEPEEIEAFGKILRVMLRYEPKERAGAGEVLQLLLAVLKGSM